MARTLGSARHARLIELVVRAREAAGLTQAEVAGRLGRHQPFVSNIESGERRVDLIELLDLAAIIGLDLNHVVEELTRVPSK
ncbi:helix-turn-helix domain-containing protein [Methylobacterium sp. NMS14P]|uniref:helix-turn-helix domain-containing protein n=1 Tax=unclassified Methylobacterium TaxID=2615210 RepID=UPI002359050F|nr:helix-turn-helix transcriptional regulator [Methylobacterium sp. NMS14P]WCS24169.1 helix-turn-helix domain-containing protein [Methylobacterium sp. NMS14P]